jgi:mRNA interferase ChpB
MAYVPSRGDILYLDFDPSLGREMQGSHFGLVISAQAFNHLGMAMICPISQGTAAQARSHGTLVTLMGCGTDTLGAIHCHQLKSLDWRARKARFKESVPQFILDDVLARIEAILFG